MHTVQKNNVDEYDTTTLKLRMLEENRGLEGNKESRKQKKNMASSSINVDGSVKDEGIGGNQAEVTLKRELNSTSSQETISSGGGSNSSVKFLGFKKRMITKVEKSLQRQKQIIGGEACPNIVDLSNDNATSDYNKINNTGNTKVMGSIGANSNSRANDGEEPGDHFMVYEQCLGLQPTVKSNKTGQSKSYRCSKKNFQAIDSLNEHKATCSEPSVPADVSKDVLPSSIYSNMTKRFTNSRKKHLCCACDMHYESFDLFLHMRDEHKRYICLFCLGMFVKAEKLAEHILIKHNVIHKNCESQEELPNVLKGSFYATCCTCERTFTERDNFYNHQCKEVDVTSSSVCMTESSQQTHSEQLSHDLNRHSQIENATCLNQSSSNVPSTSSTDSKHLALVSNFVSEQWTSEAIEPTLSQKATIPFESRVQQEGIPTFKGSCHLSCCSCGEILTDIENVSAHKCGNINVTNSSVSLIKPTQHSQTANNICLHQYSSNAPSRPSTFSSVPNLVHEQLTSESSQAQTAPSESRSQYINASSFRVVELGNPHSDSPRIHSTTLLKKFSSSRSSVSATSNSDLVEESLDMKSFCSESITTIEESLFKEINKTGDNTDSIKEQTSKKFDGNSKKGGIRGEGEVGLEINEEEEEEVADREEINDITRHEQLDLIDVLVLESQGKYKENAEDSKDNADHISNSPANSPLIIEVDNRTNKENNSQTTEEAINSEDHVPGALHFILSSSEKKDEEFGFEESVDELNMNENNAQENKYNAREKNDLFIEAYKAATKSSMSGSRECFSMIDNQEAERRLIDGQDTVVLDTNNGEQHENEQHIESDLAQYLHEKNIHMKEYKSDICKDNTKMPVVGPSNNSPNNEESKEEKGFASIYNRDNDLNSESETQAVSAQSKKVLNVPTAENSETKEIDLVGTKDTSFTFEGEKFQIASKNVMTMELVLEDKMESLSVQSVIKECIRTSCTTCCYCSHAVNIGVNGKELALHLLGEHRYEPVKHGTVDDVIERLEQSLSELQDVWLNADSYDSSDKSCFVPFNNTFQCFQCKFVTKLAKKLYLHTRSKHHILNCIMCKENFDSYSELLCHMCPGTYVSKDIQYRCCLCKMDRIPSKFRLMVHLRKIHHACDICLEIAGDQQKLSTHMRKHKLNHPCYRCAITYRNKIDMATHLFWKHNTEKVLCKKCHQKKWRHIYHFCIPPTSFNCEVCKISFSRAVALKVHKRIHTGDYPYTCSKCNRKFVSRKILEKHEKYHIEHPVIKEPRIGDKATVTKNYDKSEMELINPTYDRELKQVDGDKKSVVFGKQEQTEEHLSKSHKRKKKNGRGKKNRTEVEFSDLASLNLSSESDSFDEEKETKYSNDNNTVPAVCTSSKLPEEYSLQVAHDNFDVSDMEKEPVSEENYGTDSIVNSAVVTELGESVISNEDQPQAVPIIDCLWDDFYSYEVEQENHETSYPNCQTIRLSDPLSIMPELISNPIILPDHDYCSEKETIQSEGNTGSLFMKPIPRDHSSSKEHDCCTVNDGRSIDSIVQGSSKSLPSSPMKKKHILTKKSKKENRKLVTDLQEEPVELLIKESDLDTDESSSDEDFYDENPHKHANQSLNDRRAPQVIAKKPPPVEAPTFLQSSNLTPARNPLSSLKLTPNQKQCQSIKREKVVQTKRQEKSVSSTDDPSQPSTSFHPGNQVQYATPTAISRKRPIRMDCSKQHSKLKKVESGTVAVSSQLQPGISSYQQPEVEHPAKQSLQQEENDILQNRNQAATEITVAAAAGSSTAIASRSSNSDSSDSTSSCSCSSSSNSGSTGKESDSDTDQSIEKDKDKELYCYCQTPYDGITDMIACDGPHCSIEWFHFQCVGVEIPPKGEWYCKDCKIFLNVQ